MEQIVTDIVPQILDGVQHVPRERVQNLVGKQVVDVPVFISHACHRSLTRAFFCRGARCWVDRWDCLRP